MQGINLYPNSKIYIFAPKGVHSGGPTLLHQLASAIVKNVTTSMDKNSIEPEIVYYSIDFKNTTENAYCEYHIKKAIGLQDTPQNIAIIPEASTQFLYKFKNIQKVIWWMSVDNYVRDVAVAYAEIYNKRMFKSLPILAKFNFTDKENFFHFVQSRYALDFLRLNNVSDEKISYLSDYLEPVFLQKAKNVDITKKEKIVAYNPKKGMEFTEKIINFESNMNFIPIQNMTPEEVEELLSRAMVYIDFGSHPGKDRIPREAAALGCAVITGKRGAAENDEDIPIDAEFKFNDDENEIPNIVNKINEIFDNFPENHTKFQHYREIIFNEPQKFYQDVIKALNLNPEKKFTTVAVLQSGEKAKLCKELLKRLPQLKLVFAVGENIDDIEGISLKDAAFLYNEGRIDKFIVANVTADEKDEISSKLDSMKVSYKNCITIDYKG